MRVNSVAVASVVRRNRWVIVVCALPAWLLWPPEARAHWATSLALLKKPPA